jgi:Concanavalin A-like lectin/glucanases superfamily
VARDLRAAGSWLLLAGLLVVAVSAGASKARGVAPAGGTTYSAAVLADHPIGYWRFDDHGGVARAETGRISGRYFATRTIHGVSGTARRFDGRTSYVVVPSSTAWSQPTTGALTVEFWMRPATLTFPHEEGSGYVWVLGKGSPGSHEWGFRMYGRDNTENPPRENRIAFYAFNPSGGEGAGAYFQEQVDPGRWIYVVGELTTTGVRIFKNGEFKLGPPSKGTLYGNPAFNVTPVHGDAPLRIGTRNFHSFFEGGVDEVAIYPYLLSAQQIRHHYEVAVHANPDLQH